MAAGSELHEDMAVKPLELRKLDNLVLTVNITKEFHIRVWLAIKLIWLAAFVLGGELEISTGEKDTDG